MPEPKMCLHCQSPIPVNTDQKCPACDVKPFEVCNHQDCGRLPPVKHELQQVLHRKVGAEMLTWYMQDLELERLAVLPAI